MRYKYNRKTNTRKPLFPFLRKPAGQLAVVLLVAFIIYLIALGGGQSGNGSVHEISVDEAYMKYQDGIYVLDVSWPAEWDEYHVPNTTLIPLDQLYNRMNEVPRDREILVVSHSQTSSRQACDLLISAGINAVNMTSDLSEWFARGYSIEGAPPQ